MKTLIPILGDQLSHDLSALDGADPEACILLMMEVDEETTYVRHHKAKIAFILSAMRHHAADLRAKGWTVDYVTLDDPDNSGSFTGEVARAIERHCPDCIVATEPGEWRVLSAMQGWADKFDVPIDLREDSRFVCTHAEFDTWAAGRKQLRMEFFYRDMRRKTALLLDEHGKPEGGEWNFDSENRKPPPNEPLLIPQPLVFKPDAITREVLDLVAKRFADHPGSLENFAFATRADDALAQQAHFIKHALARFGDYQDAMLTGQPFLWHSILSPYLNCGLLDPLALCQEVEAMFRKGKVPINAAEGFIRQIIGWREYVRGIYWREGPEYAQRNALDAKRPLPGFYYDGQTDMHCMAQAIGQTMEHAYAHHIQRLMITGNFALVAGIDPHAVHQWYLEVYADAYEWVELPNTLGMSQFADGGLLASKPYASSGNYINKMSDYCGHCRYDVNAKTGSKACPFNLLYWDFLDRNEPVLGKNQRLSMVYRNWSKRDDKDKAAIRADAARFLETLTR
ncbi:cryptochrome/photolyase family protein [Blastomonas aquatica]|uniref:(6-4) photolyase n=1 Tax=Blastomonas aquatica TaxID=1510276 RepID=A0ABQ1IRS0_9SPHN|nr:cryptochrome/photolyase family protein [Blastomonas aquatica]GGB49481.1 (6-4) photolyase [Blastomonas aquatica]